jgi:Mg2+-importing ATPase
MAVQDVPFWGFDREEVLKTFATSEQGLSSEAVEERLLRYGPNAIETGPATGALAVFLNQFKSPITLILLFAIGVSLVVHDKVDSLIILMIVLISAFLGFVQEQGAQRAVETLLTTMKIKVNVLRDGSVHTVPVEEIVPGDVVDMAAGARVPADCYILDAKGVYANESALTGETFPVEKRPSVLPGHAGLAQRINCLWVGTNVVSGSVRAVAVATGRATEFGRIADRLRLRPPETEFQRGVRRFGNLLLELTLMLVLSIFAFNVYVHRPVMQSFLFSLALAVGLTPQLLPVIISINLAHGAKRMSRKRVIVKRLPSIENFGSMNVLCSDKTGTLTEGAVQVYQTTAYDGSPSERVLRLAYLNSVFESGFVNPIDEAVRKTGFDVSDFEKLDEVPYDFFRRRLSVLVKRGSGCTMVTKGAFENILEVCDRVETPDGGIVSLQEVRPVLEQRRRRLNGEGYRVLGVSYRDVSPSERISRNDERGMTFAGFLVLFDPLKENIGETVRRIKELGISLMVVTGDSLLVAAHLAKAVGLNGAEIVSGNELRRMNDEALYSRVNSVAIFAEVEPNQKERIILALKKAGNVVGFIGDGINDASALHAADVGISVDGAVDVAREAADIVMLDKDLGVLVDGMLEGRKTFANTLKYVFMATSANFGNMFSMAGASLMLPFLPLLRKQVLLNNLMTDVPEMTIAVDHVDADVVQNPRRSDMGFIRRFMLTFGLLSSVFDYATFGVLRLLLHAGPEQFRSGWFIESVVSATLIVLIIRTPKFFLKSRPHRALVATSVLVAAAAVAVPYSPLAGILSFQKGSPLFLLAVGCITCAYALTAGIAKRIFYKNLHSSQI